MQELKIKRLKDTAKLPIRMTSGSAGLDLYAAQEITIPATELKQDGLVEVGRAVVSTGLAMEIPVGMVGRIASRSGLSIKHNLEVGAGWIDSDYRGEILVEIKNFSARPFLVKLGERIAQIVLLKLGDYEILEVELISSSRRGVGGFGSTGVD
ncbi:MAG: dUTP diphosphatase [Acidobacteria bacterium]|nr:dUTP diphosphatase [Acidobacteriota bacterium]